MLTNYQFYMSSNLPAHTPINQLSDILISRIAAGEVVERPGSVVKELVENSLDAASKFITIKILDGGRSLIMVQDDGNGIPKSELSLALKRHATSKITGNNLLEISSFGFRGEGLASIASVSKLSLISKYYDHDQAYKITGDEKEEIIKDNLSKGTVITVRDLFYATPARLKFLKSERSENIYITELIKKFALAHSKVAFKLIINDKETLFYQKQSFAERLSAVFGKEFINNAIELSYSQGEYEFRGYISLPTYNRASNNLQYSFINSRLVKDKIILNAIKVAYQDYLSKDRYPIVVLFVKLPFYEVDVNVHPAKSEVRFRDSQKIRNMLISALKETLAKGAFKSAPEIAKQSLASFNVGEVASGDCRASLAMTNRQPPVIARSASDAAISHRHTHYNNSPSKMAVNRSIEAAAPLQAEGVAISGGNTQHNLAFNSEEFAPYKEDLSVQNNLAYLDYPLGSAVAQLHKTYIISQTKDGLIIIDQHAAHERLVYEKLKPIFQNDNIPTQKHLFSEIVELEENNLQHLLDYQEQLKRLGIIIEKFGAKGIVVKETPEIFKGIDIKAFIKDISDNIIEYGEALNLAEKFTEIYGNHACRNSVRAGRKLNIAEMNQILRDMEKTPFSGQCNHGRPTYIELKQKDLEKLFGRS